MTTKSILRLSIGIAMAAGLASVMSERVLAGQRDRTDRVVCESRSGGREQFCAARVEGDVRVVRELSNVPCVEGRTYRWERNGIWVRDGCRAEFAYRTNSNSGSNGTSNSSGYGYGGGANMDRVTCQSFNNRESWCPSPIGSRVAVAKQLGDTQCVEGRNWTWNQDGVRVSGNCRAEFEYRRREGGVNPADQASRQRVTCQSMNGRESFCPAPIGDDVRVLREMSDVHCERGRNWNWTNQGVRVWEGCRAEFDYRPPK